MTNRLENKIALVTGGGNGIGEAVSKRFAEEGATVVVSDITLEAAERVAADIVETGGRAVAKRQDVTDEYLWEVLVNDIVAAYGHLDILVNNAGIAIPGNVENTTLEDWRQTQAVNLDAVFLGTRATVKVMKKRGGSIINISSIEGIVGEPNTAAYNASKGGVRIFTKSAALHCGANDYGIRVNSVHPGFIATSMVADGLAALPQAEAKAMLARVTAGIPLKRMGAPIDIANGCVFLASDESAYMTGSELIIDGGYTAR